MNIRFVVALTLAFAAPAGASPAPELAAAKRAKIEAAIAKFMAANKVPGLAAAVVENGALEWSAGFGSADLENAVPATASTLFRLGSVSKPMTAVAAMQLWERGKLDLDAPVQKYCPSFPVKDQPVTTRQLLGHLGGVRHYRSDTPDDPEVANTKHFEDPIQGGLGFFANDPLVEKPGTKFHYSTQGFTLIGCAIQGASGRPYTDFMRENVFLPAGMARTGPDEQFAVIPGRTRFYSKEKEGGVRNANFLDSSYKIPGGGLIASADDVARFEEAMLGDKLVKRSTRDLMWASQKTADGAETDYGYGFRTNKVAGLPSAGHGGGQAGTSTAFLLVPGERAGVVVLTNMDDLDAAGLARELMEIVLTAAPAPQPATR